MLFKTGVLGVLPFPSSVVRRQHGRAIRAQDLQFGGPEFKSRPDRLLDCIDVKIIMSENDPDNLRLYEAFYIRKCKPTFNSREECTEFADLLF